VAVAELDFTRNAKHGRLEGSQWRRESENAIAASLRLAGAAESSSNPE
jgi:hypothetical protein